MAGDPGERFDRWLRESLRNMFDDPHGRPPPGPVPAPQGGGGPRQGAGGAEAVPEAAPAAEREP